MAEPALVRAIWSPQRAVYLHTIRIATDALRPLGALALAAWMLCACAEEDRTPEVTSDGVYVVTPVRDHLYRIIDREMGIVCYYRPPSYHAGSSISCLPVKVR